MTEETIKKSSFDELSERYDRVYENDFEELSERYDRVYEDVNDEFSDMFEDYDIVAPYSDMRMPLSPSEPWCQDSIVEAKNNMK